MRKKIVLPLIVLGSIAASANTLSYSILGYNNALKNGWMPTDSDAAVNACFNDPYMAEDSISRLYGRQNVYFRHIKGDFIELCNYLQLTQYKSSNRYLVYCNNINNKFEDISTTQGGWYENQKVPKESIAYSSSVRDNNYKILKGRSSEEIKLKLKRHYGAFLARNTLDGPKYIDIIEDAYKLYKANTTGILKVTFSAKEANKISAYMLNHDELASANSKNVKNFYNIIVGSQYRKLVSQNENYKRDFNMAKKVMNSVDMNKLKEKALLKNIKAIEYIGYFDYPIEWGNESKCYTFDINQFDKNMQNSMINSKNYIWQNKDKAAFYLDEKDMKKIGKNSELAFSIDCRTTQICKNTEAKSNFGVNFRGNGLDTKINITFFPDADKIEILNGNLKITSNGEIFNPFYDTDVIENEDDINYNVLINNKLVTSIKLEKNPKNKKNPYKIIYKNPKDIELIISQIQGKNFESLELVEQNSKRPHFSTIGREIKKGVVGLEENLEFKTVYVDDEENSVIKDNKINSEIKYGNAIYTTIEDKNFYVGLKSKNKGHYVDFIPNGNFKIEGIYDEEGLVTKQQASSSNPCGDKYLLGEQLVLKLKATDPKQINSLGLKKYTKKDGECVEITDDSSKIISNNFAIRPKYFEVDKDKIVQQANMVEKHSFNSKELKQYQDLKIGYSKIELKNDDLALINKEGSKVNFNADSIQNISKNGSFNLNINFPVATDTKLDLAETNFAINDKNNNYCIGEENVYDRKNANTNISEGKVHCYIPIKDQIDVSFIANTSAKNEKYNYCDTLENCETYNKETGEIEIDNLNKIGIKNTAYNKAMLGDPSGIVYTLNLISKNKDNKYVPVKFNDDLNIDVKLSMKNKKLLENTIITNSDNDYVGKKLNDSATIKLNISKDKLNANYKKALINLIGETDKTLSSNVKTYDEKEANYENSTTFSFKKDQIIPLQVVTLKTQVDGSDNYKINLIENFEVAYTGLLFKDKIAKDNKATLNFKSDYLFGYYDEKSNFKEDNEGLKDSNIDKKVFYKTTYETTSVSGNQFVNNSSRQYTKDRVVFGAKDKYLENSKNSFTIEFVNK